MSYDATPVSTDHWNSFKDNNNKKQTNKKTQTTKQKQTKKVNENKNNNNKKEQSKETIKVTLCTMLLVSPCTNHGILTSWVTVWVVTCQDIVPKNKKVKIYKYICRN